MNRSDQKKACLWMIHHYMDLANDCHNHYSDLCDYYIVYDHYMLAVGVWEDKLERICNE